jgi:hypothetical protein
MGTSVLRMGWFWRGKIKEMEDEVNHYDKEPYKAHVHAFFLVYHQMRTYHWWLLFCLTDLKCYRQFEVSLERVMFYGHLLISFVLMDKKIFSFGTCIRQV